MPMRRTICLIHVALLAAIATVAWPQPAPEQPPPVLGPRGVPVVGRVIWPGHDLANTLVRIYTDPELKKLVDTYQTGGSSGAIVFALNPGTYYLMAFSDQDGDGKASPGDGIGFYGVTDMKAERQPFVVDKGAAALALAIHIAFKIAEDGKALVPIPVRALTPYAAVPETPISGRVTGFVNPAADRLVLLIPVSPRFPPRAALVAKDGSFELSAVPGTYQLIAIENLNASEAIDRGDFIGAPHYEPAMGASLSTIKAEEGKEIRNLVIDLGWALAGDGRLRSGDGAVLGPRINLGGLPAICAGVVSRFGKPVAGATVRAYADETLKELQYSTKTDDEGRFCLGMSAANYYLVARRDVDGDGATGPGDELGFLGIDETQLSAKPTAVGLRPGQLRTDANIPLVMVVGDDSKPRPIASEGGHPPKAEVE